MILIRSLLAHYSSAFLIPFLSYTFKGRTIWRVILSISEHPINFNRNTWEGLYVALSRVRLRDHIRLLLRQGRRSTMNYIRQLKKNNYTKCFFQGYECVNSLHPAFVPNFEQRQQPMVWNSQQASLKAGFLNRDNGRTRRQN